MKQALISPIESRDEGFRVAEVAEQAFPVCEPFFWVECDDSIVADAYWYNPTSNEFVPFPAPEVVAPNLEQPVSNGAQTF